MSAAPAFTLSVDDLRELVRDEVAKVLQSSGAKGGDALVPLRVAAERAVTTVRVVREAIRVGALRAYGKQRDRAVRVADLNDWIESRRMPSSMGPDDADMDRRVAQVEKRMRAGKGNA